jgi:hypothetical protein
MWQIAPGWRRTLQDKAATIYAIANTGAMLCHRARMLKGVNVIAPVEHEKHFGRINNYQGVRLVLESFLEQNKTIRLLWGLEGV